MADLNLLAVISGKDQLSGPARAAAQSLNGLERAAKESTSAFGSLSGAMRTGIGIAAGLSIFSTASDALRGAASSAINFEKSMSGISAVSGATGAQMKELSGLALDLGKKTSFSAGEAAKGIEELIKGGVSIGDVFGGAAAASLNLAAAGEISVGAAAEIAANAMNNFGLKGSDMARVSDLIAGAANASSLSVNDFKFSLSAVGAVAKLAGQGFDSTAVAIAQLGAAGIKGSDAGTSLKAVLSNLIPTTVPATKAMRELGIITSTGANQFVDSTGKIKDFGAISQILKTQTAGLTDAQRLLKLEMIFGSDGMRAAGILAKEGGEGFAEMAAAMGKVTAESVAMERLNNLAGDLEQLKGSAETAGIIMLSTLSPALRGVAQAATEFVNGFAQEGQTLIQTAQNIASEHGIGMLPAAFTTVELRIREVFGDHAANIFHGFVDLVKGAADGVSRFVSWMGENLSTLGGIVSRVLDGDIRGAFDAWLAYQGRVTADIVAKLSEWGQAFIDWVQPLIGPMLAALSGLAQELGSWILSRVPDMLARLSAWRDAFLDWVTPLIGPLLSLLGGLAQDVGSWIASQAPAILAQLTAWKDAFLEWVAPMVGPFLAQLGGLAQQLGGWILGRVPDILAWLGGWATPFVTWIGKAIPAMLAGLSGLIRGLLDSIASGGNQASAATGSTWVAAFVGWVAKGIPLLVGALVGINIALLKFIAEVTVSAAAAALRLGFAIVSSIVQAIGEKLGEVWAALIKLDVHIRNIGAVLQASAVQVGKDIIIGLSNGITGAQQWVIDAATRVGAAAIAAAKSALGIASPSKEFMEIGAFVAEGFALGISENLSPVEQAAAEMAQKVEDAEREHQIRIGRMWEDAGSKKGDARKAALERIERAEEDHARKVEGINESGAARIVQLERDQSRRRGDALMSFLGDMDKLEQDVTAKAASIGEKLGDTLLSAASDAQRAIGDVVSRAGEQWQSAAENLGLSRILRGRRDDFSSGQSLESKRFKERRDDSESEHRWTQDKLKAQEKYTADLAKLKLKESANATESEKTKERVAREALETRLVEEIQAADKSWEAAKKETLRRRGLEEEERVFKASQDTARRAFDDGLENEALAKTQSRLVVERDSRVSEIAKALEEKQRKLETQAVAERDLLIRSYGERVTDLRDKFLGKLGPLTETAQTTLLAFLDRIAARTSEVAGELARVASSSASALTGVSYSGGGGGGGSSESYSGPSVSDFASDASPAFAMPSFDAPSSGGQTFGDQSSDVQELFQATWGDQAAAQWQAEHAITVNVNVEGSVQSEQDLTRSIYNGLLELERSGLRLGAS